MTKNIRFLSEFQDVRFVRELVWQREGQAFFAEDLNPVGHGRVGGAADAEPVRTIFLAGGDSAGPGRPERKGAGRSPRPTGFEGYCELQDSPSAIVA